MQLQEGFKYSHACKAKLEMIQRYTLVSTLRNLKDAIKSKFCIKARARITEPFIPEPKNVGIKTRNWTFITNLYVGGRQVKYRH